MGRKIILGGLGVAGVYLLARGGLAGAELASGPGAETTCAEFLREPETGPVQLRECRLDFDKALVMTWSGQPSEMLVALAAADATATEPYVLVSLRNPELLRRIAAVNWDEIDFEAFQRSAFSGRVEHGSDSKADGVSDRHHSRTTFGVSDVGELLHMSRYLTWSSVLFPGVTGLILLLFVWLNLWGPWSR